MSKMLTALSKQHKMLYCPFCGDELPQNNWNTDINEKYIDRTTICTKCKLELTEAIDGEISFDNTITKTDRWSIRIKTASNTQLDAYASENEETPMVDMLKDHRTPKNIIQEL